ncbi:hypothetical protein NHP200010_06890 [Helicobacter bizzozeronii]|nr:hypothetical protein NHP200010_06890 [Helicobacter bizzozeronii]
MHLNLYDGGGDPHHDGGGAHHGGGDGGGVCHHDNGGGDGGGVRYTRFRARGNILRYVLTCCLLKQKYP